MSSALIQTANTIRNETTRDPAGTNLGNCLLDADNNSNICSDCNSQSDNNINNNYNHIDENNNVSVGPGSNSELETVTRDQVCMAICLPCMPVCILLFSFGICVYVA